MDMKAALAKAGIDVPEKPSKIKEKAQTTALKINSAYKIVNVLEEYVIRYNGVHDEIEHNILRDAIVTRFNELTQFFIDISLLLLSENYQKRFKNKEDLKKNVSLNLALRQISSTLLLNNEQQLCLDTFQLRNEAVHDYINSDINKEDVVAFFLGYDRINNLNSIVTDLETYCKENKFM